MKLLMFQGYLYTKHIPPLNVGTNLTYIHENQQVIALLNHLTNQKKDMIVYNFRKTCTKHQPI